jgi:hypothetical protein
MIIWDAAFDMIMILNIARPTAFFGRLLPDGAKENPAA